MTQRIAAVSGSRRSVALVNSLAQWPYQRHPGDSVLTTAVADSADPAAAKNEARGRTAAEELELLELQREREELLQMQQTALRRVNALLKREPLAPLTANERLKRW